MSNADTAGPYLAREARSRGGRKTASLTLENAYASLCLILLLNFATKISHVSQLPTTP